MHIIRLVAIVVAYMRAVLQRPVQLFESAVYYYSPVDFLLVRQSRTLIYIIYIYYTEVYDTFVRQTTRQNRSKGENLYVGRYVRLYNIYSTH